MIIPKHAAPVNKRMMVKLQGSIYPSANAIRQNKELAANAIKAINDALSTLTGLAINLIVTGVVVGILYNDVFGVIGNIASAMASIGDNGLAGLITIAIVAMWMKK